jgi:predicted phosphodiesterase
MKIAVISDIHANLEALTSVLTRIDALNIASIYCLGDIVGYGASPNECVELIRMRKIPTVVGNHDKAAAGALSIDDFSSMAKEGILWTRSVLTRDNREYLDGLGYTMTDHKALFVHSSPDEPQEFRYLLSYGHAIESFHAFDQPLCFIGHTHRPILFCEDGSSDVIIPSKKFIVNVGSVGQPRDGDRRGCFTVFDTEEYTLEYERVEYDIDAARSKIINAGLPKKLGDRLLVGM